MSHNVKARRFAIPYPSWAWAVRPTLVASSVYALTAALYERQTKDYKKQLKTRAQTHLHVCVTHLYGGDDVAQLLHLRRVLLDHMLSLFCKLLLPHAH